MMFLLVYLFFGFLSGAAIIWALDKMESYDNTVYSNKMKFIFCIFYITCWPFAFICSTIRTIKWHKIENWKNELNEDLKTMQEFSDFLEDES